MNTVYHKKTPSGTFVLNGVFQFVCIRRMRKGKAVYFWTSVNSMMVPRPYSSKRTL